MSDQIRMTGRLTFEPPLTWVQYRDHKVHESSMLVIEEDVQARQTDEGELITRTAVAVVPRKPNAIWGKGGYLRDEIAPLVALALAAGSRLTGYLYGNDGSPLDVYRYWVEMHPSANTAPNGWHWREETAVLAWPDGASAYEITVTPVGKSGSVQRVYAIGTGPTLFECAARPDVQ